jgi:hypothetical protein
LGLSTERQESWFLPPDRETFSEQLLDRRIDGHASSSDGTDDVGRNVSLRNLYSLALPASSVAGRTFLDGFGDPT